VKTLRIAYCGGCNAAYDRVAFVNGLVEDVRAAGGDLRLVDPGEADPDKADPDEAGAVALIVAGCPAVCVADREDMGAGARVRHVVGPNMLDAVTMPMSAVHDRLKTELSA